MDDAAWSENEDADEFMLQPGSIYAITDFWNWINDGAGSGDVGLHGDFSSYDEWEEARGLVERGERKLSDYGGELPGIEPPEEWKRYCDWQRHFRLSEFGCGEWVELAQKMFDFTGDNVFVIGTVGEAPTILLTNNDLRNVPPSSRSPTPTGEVIWLRPGAALRYLEGRGGNLCARPPQTAHENNMTLYVPPACGPFRFGFPIPHYPDSPRSAAVSQH